MTAMGLGKMEGPRKILKGGKTEIKIPSLWGNMCNCKAIGSVTVFIVLVGVDNARFFGFSLFIVVVLAYCSQT